MNHENLLKVSTNNIIEELIFRTISEMPSTAVFVYHGRKFIWVNNAFEIMTGYSKEEALNLDFWDIVHPDYRKYRKEIENAQHETDHPIRHYELKLLTKYGQERWIDFVPGSIEFEGMLLHSGIAYDITELKKPAKELKITNDTLNSFIENTPDAIAFIDVNGKVVKINRAFEKLYGYKADEVVGKELPTLPEPAIPEFKSIIEKVRTEQIVYNYETMRKRKNGILIPISVTASAIRDNNGNVVAIAGISRDRTLQKRAEEAFRESEKRYRLIADNVHDIIWTMDLNLRYTYISPSVERIRGYPVEEAMKQSLDKILSPASYEIARKTYAEALMIEKTEKKDSQKTRTLTLEFIRKDGSTVWCELSMSFLRNADGVAIGILGVTRDITDRKKSEDQLLVAMEQLESFFNNTPDAVIIMDLKGKVMRVNAAFETILGWAPQEVIGGTLPSVPEQFISKFLKEFKETKEGTTLPGFETFATHKSGKSICISVTFFPIHDVHNNIVAIANVARDVTERTRLQQMLKDSEEKYHTFFEEDISGTYISTPEGKIIACNPAFVDIFGFDSVEDVLKVNASSLHYNPQDRESFLNVIREKRSVTDYAAILRHRNGTPVYAIEKATGKFNEQGELTEIKGYFFDYTNQKKLEEQLLESKKLESLARITTGVAHHFNNILNGIMGYSQMNLNNISSTYLVRENMNIIHELCLKGTRIINDLFSFSKQQFTYPIVFDTNELISSSLESIQTAMGKSIDVKFISGPNLYQISADINQINEVIINMSENAKDAMPNGGTLHIQTKNIILDEISAKSIPNGRAGSFVLLSFKDTGTGMESDVLMHIFEPFYTTKEVGKGTGLGLATIYGIITQHNGFIHVESKKGEGTTFSIYLPAVPKETS